MPAVVLSPAQLRFVLDLLGHDPERHSPLTSLSALADQPDPAAGPELDPIAERHLIEPDADGWRLNHLFRSVIAACLDPDEVIGVQTFGGDWPGFTICRKGPLVTECTLGLDGSAKFAFPISRSAVQLSLAAALSSDRPEPEPMGFAFRGSPTAAFVLSLLMDVERAGRPSLDRDGLLREVGMAVNNPMKTLGLALVAGADAVLTAARPDSLDAAVIELGEAGMVVVDGDVLRPTEPPMTVLSSPVLASFIVSRVAIVDGAARTKALHASRVGGRIVTFRVSDTGEGRQVEWLEVSRRQLRSLVHAVTMTDDELDALTG